MIIHDDCTNPDLLNSYAECDVMIADFPYSPHVHENAMSSHTLASGGPKARDLGFAALTPELREFGCLVASLMARWTVVFSDLQGAHLWDRDMDRAGLECIRWLPWVRWSQPQQSGDRPPSGAEAVCAYHVQTIGARGGRKPISKHWNGSGGLIALEERSLRGADKHPTQKPLDVMLTLVSAFSDPGETVLDLVAGYATTEVAAILLGRQCVSVERDAAWAERGAARVEDATKGLLDKRDADRAAEWCAKWEAEARSVPEPRGDAKQRASMLRTWQRAQQRLADVLRVKARP
jgi:hypothetical protein